MYLLYLENKSFCVYPFHIEGGIKIKDEVAERLLEGIYEVEKRINEKFEDITLENFNDYFKEVVGGMQKKESLNYIEILSRQVNLLTLENKKKDIQIENLMKVINKMNEVGVKNE